MAVSTSVDRPKNDEVSTNRGPENEASSSTASLSCSAAVPSAAIRPLKRTELDSENGISCHQCRHKIRDVVVVCQQPKTRDKNKLCPVKICLKCLRNRYGERADEVAEMEDWSCPRCRGICSCILCKKKRGQYPTDILIHTAKENDFSSMHELLSCKEDQLATANEPKSMSQNKSPASEKKRSCDKRNINNELMDIDVQTSNYDGSKELDADEEKKRLSKKLRIEFVSKYLIRSCENKSSAKGKDLQSTSRNSVEKASLRIDNKVKMPVLKEMIFPLGTALTEVDGVHMKAEDVGAALEFLEFCNAFSQVLDIKEGEPQSILRGLATGFVGHRRLRRRRGVCPPVVKFHMKLLSCIQDDMVEESLSVSPGFGDSWLLSLVKCINEHEHKLSGSPLNCFQNEPMLYDTLSTSNKLKVMNLLCSRTLDTEKLRTWIDKENMKLCERKKEAINDAEQKVKEFQQKLKDKMTETIVSVRERPISSSNDHISLYSQIKAIKAETEKAYADIERCKESIFKDSEKQSQDVVRTEPVFLGKGHRYWKLQGSFSGSKIILQDIGSWDSVRLEDKWLCYNEDEERAIEAHISS